MTWSSHKDELSFNPKIERTFNRLKRKARGMGTDHAPLTSSPGINITLKWLSSSKLGEEEDMATNNQTLKELATFDFAAQPLCIEYLNLNAAFELKSGLIHLLPTFCCFAGEDPHKHLKEFHVVRSTMKP